MAMLCYKVSGPDIVFEQFNGDLVVLNLGTGRYFGLNPSAASLWLALMAGATSEQLTSHGVDAGWVDVYVRQLVDQGLVVPVETDAVAVLDETLVVALAGSQVAPAIESYDDLSDLIIADPIHDVDQQAGWPNLPQAKKD